MIELVKEELRAIGFYKLLDGLPDLYAQAAHMAKHAGDSGTGPHFELLPSYLLTEKEPVDAKKNVLAVDIGGTSTKAGVRLVSKDGAVSWRYLFEQKNTALRNTKTGLNSFAEFADTLAANIKQSLAAKDIDEKSIQDAGIIWSNAIKNHRAPNLGISGAVTAREHYNKGEWFIKDLKNGDDLAAPLLEAFKAAELNIKHLVITNDTPFTLSACKGAVAGVVASTGVNATLLMTETGANSQKRQVICNAEMGGRFKLKESLLSEADLIADGRNADTIEYMIGGRFIPTVFCAHLIRLGQNGIDAFKKPVAILNDIGEDKWGHFNTRDLSSLIYNQDYFLGRHPEYINFSKDCLDAMKVLAAEVLSRAARLLTTVVYGSIANQIAEGETTFKVSLDSRLAREVPLFWDAFKEQLAVCLPAPLKVEIVLAEPITTPTGSISVPMQGAANAMDSLIDD